MSTVGPHDLSNYAVHQFEPIVAVMGVGVKRVKAFAVGNAVTQLLLDYGDGRMASFTQTPNPFAEFNFMVSDGMRGERLESADYYINTMRAILDFFITRVPPVPEEETLEVLALIEAAKQARQILAAPVQRQQSENLFHHFFTTFLFLCFYTRYSLIRKHPILTSCHIRI